MLREELFLNSGCADVETDILNDIVNGSNDLGVVVAVKGGSELCGEVGVTVLSVEELKRGEKHVRIAIFGGDLVASAEFHAQREGGGV